MHSNGTHLNRARVVFHPNIHYTHPTRGRGVYERFSFEFEHEDEHRGFSSPRCACLLPVNVLRPRFVFPDNTRAPPQYIHIPSYTSPRCSNLYGRLNRDRVSGIGGVECNETLEIRVINTRFETWRRRFSFLLFRGGRGSNLFERFEGWIYTKISKVCDAGGFKNDKNSNDEEK